MNEPTLHGTPVENGPRVVVDRDLCEAHAVCSDVAPEVFRVTASDELELRTGAIPVHLVSRVEEAVRRCPRHALRLVHPRESRHEAAAREGEGDPPLRIER